MTAPLVSRSTEQDCNRLYMVKSETKDAVALIAETLMARPEAVQQTLESPDRCLGQAAAERARQLAQLDD
ncbi:hypothetical protein EFV37_32270 [Mesorhizobium loti]|uniref:Uncharacterized protein n=1 Tax=Rhizobium loti TaxID=381 RepID=M5AN50_RHILI|nr:MULTISPECIES: hypothetical protein [Mesorhizobium]ANN60797.1 hypothetical protein A9174_31600 [Mesorhizobium loti NZP2037]OBP79928.1 hypothetical protein BAE41_29190 [Mesorhizobium loti]OBP96425.1 hypothetical protein BAE38_29630 [Mesorhizobium loti]OBQ73223.1 hypothetical protein A9K72_31535 [Mesorhizobium loti]QKC66381.1 hypothetical protein EB229_32260 [Mesorhizobium jarvisii]